MERTAEEIQQLYDEHEKYIRSTIRRRYGNPAYINSHGLQRCDLIQYGRIGLYNACKTYDDSKNTTFQSHAINHIVWSINKESKKDSLNNINKYSNELLNKTSMDATVSAKYEEPLTLYDIVEDNENGINQVEIEDFLASVESSISADVKRMLSLRIDGLSFQEIGEITGVTRQTAYQMYKRNKEKIVSLYVGV